MVPARAAPVLAATLNVKEPDPVPVAALVIVIHGTFLLALQPHPAALVTETLPMPPAAEKLVVAEDGVTVHAAPGVMVTPTSRMRRKSPTLARKLPVPTF
jgi:hypothetical protein